MNTNELITIIELLKKENECLRSVLSEFEGDKYEYLQMIRADDYQRVREHYENG